MDFEGVRLIWGVRRVPGSGRAERANRESVAGSAIERVTRDADRGKQRACRDFPNGEGQVSPAPVVSFMKMITVVPPGRVAEEALHAGSRATTGYRVNRERRSENH